MAGGPNVAILGAGSVGCFIGGTWAAAGVPVTFIGRPRLSRDIDEHGLTLTDYSGWRAHLEAGEIDYRCGPEALEGAQVIAVTVKSADTARAAADIAKHGTPGATIISFQNGVSNVETLEEGLGGRFEVARGMVPFNVAYLGEGRFHKGVAGELYAEQRAAVRSLANAAGTGPAVLRLREDMLALAWGKLLINLNNAVNALSGKTLREELRCRDYRRVFAGSIREGLDLLKGAEIEPESVGPLSLQMLPRVLNFPDWLFNRIFLTRWKIDAKARSSMADDLVAGRKTEIDYLNGELVRLADRLQRAAPINRAIVELVHEAEAGAPPLEPEALRKAVLRR
ncbi:MAG TPA: 2-dehydropantoate 2-reductase [Sphingomicrobium sp.]|nr:2-dehydropantoate 2-reductase [Sphingomicrobium sp.]